MITYVWINHSPCNKMSLFLILFLTLTFLFSPLNGVNIGFKTSSGDKIIIGEISSRANGVQIRRMMVELAEIKISYETFLNGAACYATPNRLMKQVTRIDGSISYLYELSSCGFVCYIKLNARVCETLSSFAIIFDTILLITSSNINLQEHMGYQPKEVIMMNLVDEIRDQTDLSFNFDGIEDDKKDYSTTSINDSSCLIC